MLRQKEESISIGTCSKFYSTLGHPDHLICSIIKCGQLADPPYKVLQATAPRWAYNIFRDTLDSECEPYNSKGRQV